MCSNSFLLTDVRDIDTAMPAIWWQWVITPFLKMGASTYFHSVGMVLCLREAWYSRIDDGVI